MGVINQNSLDDFLSKYGQHDWGNVMGKSFNKTASYDPAKDQAAAQGDIEAAKDAYSGLTPPSFTPVDYQGPAEAPDASATAAGPSAMNGISTNPANNKAQTAQMSALQDLAAHGGRNAASDANLAQIQAEENQNARGQRDAIMQNANARGMGGSGASLLAELTGSQSDIDRQSARDLAVSGQEANTALQAGQGAASIGSNMENQDFGEQASKAAANDRINEFNAANSTGVNEFNTSKNQGVNNAMAGAKNQGQTVNNYEMPQTSYQDSAAKAQGLAGANINGADYFGKQVGYGEQAKGNMMGGVTQIGSKAIESFASSGGRIPGTPRVRGDSPLNDIVPVQTSPGEVVVPRSLAASGSAHDIGNFVKHAPPVNPNRNHEAMLSALKHMAGRR